MAFIVLGLLLAFTVNAQAQNKEWKEGSVWDVTMIRIKPGAEDDYLKSLHNTLKVMYDEAVKQGLILSYKILTGSSANRDDYDTMILVEYKNMAAMEGHDAQWDAIKVKALAASGGEKTVMQMRVDQREILGQKTMREIIFN